jgi:subtilisin family serine protease
MENAPWGLMRISSAKTISPSRYYYPDEAGQGVDIYVIDTGVDASHPEFGGRVVERVSFVSGESSNVEDGHGHGTHVAGTCAGVTFGVAKKANLIGVRVLDNSGSGWWTDVIAGIEWVYNRHASNNRPSVINMSLGGDTVDAVDAAVNAAVAAGVYGKKSVDLLTTSHCICR